jgi:hypothetical protein
VSPGLLHILQHSLGLDQYGRGEIYRNRFVTGPDGDDYAPCRELVGLGFMVEHPPRELTGGMSCFVVTDAGRAACVLESPRPPKVSRGRKRYQEWLDADCSLSFGEWMKRPRRTT